MQAGKIEHHNQVARIVDRGIYAAYGLEVPQ